MNSNELLLEILKLLKQKYIKSTMTVVECSTYLNISKDKIRELINKTDTDFSYFKVGTKVLINKVQLDSWICKISTEHRVL
ncbi:helix-turn-helix domain-containing protein [Clostridium botulinum]|nr:helix-turn-helix domain-containing protein [Clostridium botulinum]